MKIGFFQSHLLASTIIAGSMIAAPAFAQSTPTDQLTASADQVEADDAGDIVVTGSRISNPNLTSSSPISVIEAKEIKLQGATRLEDVLNSMPQVFASQSSSVSNGSTGTATLNLRNLGSQRTLVLVNGRRLMPGDPVAKSSAADINVLPQNLIKRIDVLTGGASSVYGSDAVGGVVNFILDTDYEGFSIDTTYGLYNHNNRNDRFQRLSAASNYPAPDGQTFDGQQFDVNLKVGAATSDGRGHIVAYAGYREIRAIQQGDRDYSSCSINAPRGNVGSDYVCGGSVTAFPANFTLGDTVRDGPPTSYTLNAAGALVPETSLYNANPLNYYQRPDKRITAGFMARYEVSDAFKPYAEFNFMDDRTVAQIAPSGDFNNTGTLNCDNPLFSATQLATFCRPSNLVGTRGIPTAFPTAGGSYNQANVRIARRNVEGGPRQADITHTSYRIVAGARGDIDSGISYDTYAQYGTTKYNLIYRNEFSISKTVNALDVVRGPNGPQCRSLAANPTCVPLDIFGSAPITPAALNYVQQSGFQQGETKEIVVNAAINVRGSEYGIKSPWSDEGIGLSIGGEYRQEKLNLEVDQAFRTGDLAGQGGPTQPIAGSYDVKELFAELQVPIVTDKPFFHELTLNGGYRYSHYAVGDVNSYGVSSYKGEVTWAPVRDIAFRGGYNRAVRAPNIQEMFFAQSVQIDGASDPCAGPATSAGLVNGWTAAQCARTGVAPERHGLILANPSTQYNGQLGGNLLLKPEKADTITIGAIFQPTFLPGFTASVDAFSIKIKDVIDTVGTDTILSQCVATGNPALCGAIHRDSFGSLWQTPQGYTVNTNVNAGTFKTRGIDVKANYNLRTDTLGTVSLDFFGTYVDEFTREKAGTKFDCAGLFGAQCGAPQSKWRHQVRLSWNGSSGIGLSARWRYLSGTTFERASGRTGLTGAYFARDAHVAAISYFDLAATARVADKFSFRLGVNNILDKQPPILSSTAAPISSLGNGNTYPGIYDANGRYLFAGFSLDF